MWLISMEGQRQLVVSGSISPPWQLYVPPTVGLDIVATLRKELDRERAFNMQLAMELAEERLKVTELETITGRMALITPTEPQQTEAEVSIGAYSAKVRREKIAKYKRKLLQHRGKTQLSRTFPGRSGVARSKPRVNGRFVKQET